MFQELRSAVYAYKVNYCSMQIEVYLGAEVVWLIRLGYLSGLII
jgi:hypothetical protein